MPNALQKIRCAALAARKARGIGGKGEEDTEDHDAHHDEDADTAGNTSQ